MTQVQARRERAQALADPAAFDEVADPALRRYLVVEGLLAGQDSVYGRCGGWV